VRQAAQCNYVEYIGADAGDHGQGAERDFIQLAPGLIGGVTIVTASDLELGDLDSLLFLDAYAPLRQLQHARLAYVDLQAVVEQSAFKALLMLAALRQLIGAAAEKEKGAEQGGTGAEGLSLEHAGFLVVTQLGMRAARKAISSVAGNCWLSLSRRCLYSRLPSARLRSLTTMRCGMPISSMSANLTPGLVFLSRSSSSTSKPAAVSCSYSASVACFTDSFSYFIGTMAIWNGARASGQRIPRSS